MTSHRPWVALAAVPPLFSFAFLDYGTSGLETPLSFVLVAVFYRDFLGKTEVSPLRLSLIATLAVLNRPDVVLFFGPAILYLVLERFSLWRLVQIGVGFSPLILWELFSLFYYGFPFPNTKYAKMPPNVDLDWYLSNCLLYILSLVKEDPVSACLLVGGVVLALAAGIIWLLRRSQSSDSSLQLCLLGLGIVTYCVYVVWVGGDFMRGRFFAVPIFASTVLLWRFLPKRRADISPAWYVAVVTVLAFLGIRYGVGDTYWYNARTRITDERQYYLKTNSMEAWRRGVRVKDNGASQQGIEMRDNAERLREAGVSQPLVVSQKYIGMRGYFAGPDVVIVDEIGLADPLIARLGVKAPRTWRVGHGIRNVPDGYLYARRTGSLEHMDPSLPKYYEVFNHIMSGPLIDSRRIAEIVRINLGTYDHLLRELEQRHRRQFPSS